ncbi:hypothetical protein OEA41_006149 [Lepraria neglecta]|uniref:Uncharacterized protein n=1 Tax=Lepraria neglecta TaxID=209136 RepID=A0AAE0DK84_9LECA|nr:hypothetical protein OEA41_006149 [Lepraria neglecta]
MGTYPPPDYFSGPLKHPFLHWLVDIVGASFFDFSQRELRDQLNSRQWKEHHFLHEFYRSTMLKLNWNNPDTIELKYWPLMLEQARLPSEAYCYPLPGNPTLTPRDTILGRADKLRNAVFDRHEIWMCALRDIMRIPAVLKDDTRAAQVELVWKVVSEDSDVEEQTISKVHKMLDITHSPCTTFLQVHSRVLALLEDGCFRFGKRKDPRILEHMGWYAVEDVELRMWKSEWFFNVPPLWNPESLVNHFILGGKQITQLELLRAVFDDAVDLRNSVAHRNILNQGTLCWYAQLAKLLLILFDERKLAIEIEALVEGFLSKKSRDEVLSRLSEYYDGRDVPADQLGEFKRRDAVLEIHGQMEAHQRSEEARRHSFDLYYLLG